MIKKIFILLILFFGIIANISALQINPKIENIYSNFVIKVEKINFDLNNQNKTFIAFNNKITDLKKSSKYKNNTAILNILDQLIYLNDIKIKKTKKAVFLAKLKANLEIKNKVIDNNNYNYEFNLEKERRKKIIDSKTYSKYFENILYTKNNIFLENGVWYTYNFKNYSFFPENLEITKTDLENNNINLKTDLLFVTEKNTLGFIKNPQKIRLISDNLISSINNKYYFLEELKDDIRDSGSINYEADFIKLKELTQELTYNLNDDSKIINIYNYILNNVEYSKIIDFNNYKIFSGIETYKNNDGTCEGYVKIMTYMLLFAGINDVEVIRGYVIDARDFPQIGHAWVKVLGNYYDPTFDDPLGSTESKKFSEYKYFNLPKDLFYTNRYDETNLPEYIKTLSLEDRKLLIQKNLYDILTKYKNSDYKLLELIKIKKENNISYDEKIDLNNFTKILPLRDVLNFSFIENGNKKQIIKFKYYELSNNNIEILLEQLDYDLNGYYYFKWYNNDGSFDYKLGYDVEF